MLYDETRGGQMKMMEGIIDEIFRMQEWHRVGYQPLIPPSLPLRLSRKLRRKSTPSLQLRSASRISAFASASVDGAGKTEIVRIHLYWYQKKIRN
jgi:hypothetical protein